MSGGASATTVTAVIGTALAAAGTAASVAGSMQQASAASASAKYQSEVAAGNQATATQNANYAAASGEAQAAIQEQKTRSQVGAIEAAQGSSGVDINSPTATSVRTSQNELGQLDADTIRSNAARQAYGYETQSTNFENQSAADIAQGENAETAGYLNAGTGLLNGAGNASLNYAKVIGNGTGIDTSGSVNVSGANATGPGGISGNG